MAVIGKGETTLDEKAEKTRNPKESLADEIYNDIFESNKQVENDKVAQKIVLSGKNGLGKTSIFNALHYCLYGKAIGNKVTLPNLVNNINKKNMFVSLTFRKDDTFYRIERGRSPNFVKFFKENDEITDETLGDSRDTQDVIEEVIGMGEELFNQTVLLTKNVPIFMDQTTSNQKLIIEKVLGVDIITKKIESLKERIKNILNYDSLKYSLMEYPKKFTIIVSVME